MKEGWELKELGELCNIFNGLWKGKKQPFVTVGVIRNTNFTKDCLLDTKDIAYLEVEEKQYQNRKLEYGDLVIEKSGGGPKQAVGRVIPFELSKGEYSFSNFTSVLRVKNKLQVDFKYLHKFLLFFYITGQTEKMQSHTIGIRNLDFSRFKQITIPIPSLSEQKGIVEILDKAFAKIDTVKQNAEINLKNIEGLFLKILSSNFIKKEGWISTELGNVCSLYQGLAINAKTKHLLVKNSNLPLLRIKDLKNGTEELYVSEQGYPKSSLVNEDEIIYTRTGSLGLVFTGRYGILHNNCFKIVPNRELDKKFLIWFLQEPKFKKTILSLAERAAQPDITHKLFKEQIISYPSLSEQQQIVSKLDALSAKCKELENNYLQTINDCDELKKAILAKAFNGEL